MFVIHIVESSDLSYSFPKNFSTITKTNKHMIAETRLTILWVFLLLSLSTSECSVQGQVHNYKRRNQASVLPKAGLPPQIQEPRL